VYGRYPYGVNISASHFFNVRITVGWKDARFDQEGSPMN
jgi:hypothetical protein